MTQPLEVRPRKLRWAAWFTAVAFVAIMTAAAVVLRNVPTGVYFRTADQVALIVLGLLFAAGALVFTRPRLRADADGVEVRNLITTRHFPWEVIQAVSFPDGSPWARLELPADEYASLMAIQSVDRARAVEAIRALRALHAEHTVMSPPGD